MLHNMNNKVTSELMFQINEASTLEMLSWLLEEKTNTKCIIANIADETAKNLKHSVEISDFENPSLDATGMGDFTKDKVVSVLKQYDKIRDDENDLYCSAARNS